MDITRREVFGSALDDIGEAAARSNGSDYGLDAHVLARELSIKHRAAALFQAAPSS